MPEILTESFCERCGTRYTFQSTAPKVGRMAKMKVLGRGLRNYVMSDDTSLDEAFAEARSTDDRQHSVEQLDAFHKTFNFCMSCRQYTCANCWNEAEGRCLSCAPTLGPTGALAPFAGLEPVAGIGGLAGNGHGAGNGHAEATLDWPDAESAESVAGGPSVSRLEALFGRTAPEPVAPADGLEAADATEGTGASEAEGPSTDRHAVHEPELIGLEANAPAEAESDQAAVGPLAAIADGAEAVDVAEAAALTTGEGSAAAAADVTEAADDLPEASVAAIAGSGAPTADGTETVVQAEHAGAETGQADDEATGTPVAAIAPETDDLAAAASAKTHDLLDRFRARPVVTPPVEPPQPIGSRPTPPSIAPAHAPDQRPLPYAAALGGAVGPAHTPQAYEPPTPAYPAPAARPVQPYGPPAAPQTPPGYAPPPYGGPAQPYAGGPLYAPPAPAYPPAPQPQYPPAMPYASPPPQYVEPTYLAYPAIQPQYPAPAVPQPPYPGAGPAPQQPYVPAPQSYGPATQPAYPPAPQPQYPPAPGPQQQYPVPNPAQPPRPSWRMVAPEAPVQAQPQNGHVHEPLPEPEWPTSPSWPAPLARTSRTRGAEAVWAESTRDLLTKAEAGVSACFNCGLPLSATARFCRRCGTSQVSA